MTDIVERLRCADAYNALELIIPVTTCREAADEIERLRAELENERNSVRILPANNPYIKNGDKQCW